MIILLDAYDLSLGDKTVALVKLDKLLNFARHHRNISFQVFWVNATNDASFNGVVYPVISHDGTNRIRTDGITIDAANNTGDNTGKVCAGVWSYVGVDVDVENITGGLLTVKVEGEPID